jgi:dTDP-4-dehydrorhamnose reductase
MINPMPTTVLVLGASGMLGNAVLRFFAASPGYTAFGSMRTTSQLAKLPSAVRRRVIAGVDVENTDSLMRLFSAVRPQVVINCIGLVKQLAEADDPLLALPINAMLPHRLARLCDVASARLVHVSTDCVFSGARGNYIEGDSPDAQDLYGRSKLLGEVDYPHAVTLRTSIIGHELSSANGLVGWFLAQQGRVSGYRRAVFSGLPTIELLKLVARTYGKEIEIVEDDAVLIDRSLDSTRFRTETGYAPDDWPALVARMHAFQASAAD